jgi:hypothetical protein
VLGLANCQANMLLAPMWRALRPDRRAAASIVSSIGVLLSQRWIWYRST